MMKTKMIYMILLFSSILFGGCVRDVIDDVPGTDEDYAADKKDVVLIRMGTNDAEVKDITSRLFNNIPSSWEIGKKTIVDYDKMKDPETELNADIKNPKIYMTVILNIDDVISGKYPISLFRMLKFYKRDFYVIATQSTPEQKEEMLSLIGVYMEAGYYAINYDNVQHYRIFPSADPYAKDNMIGKGVASFNQKLLTRSADTLPEGNDPDPGYNAQMADKEALKRIEIYNRIYGYAQGDMNYSMQAVPYKMKPGAAPDVIIDNSWAIDAYNFQIYSKNNNCILSITNNAGNGFTANIKDYTTPKGANVYAYIWNLMREASSEITVHSDGGIFREISYQPQTNDHFIAVVDSGFDHTVSLYLQHKYFLIWENFCRNREIIFDILFRKDWRSGSDRTDHRHVYEFASRQGEIVIKDLDRSRLCRITTDITIFFQGFQMRVHGGSGL